MIKINKDFFNKVLSDYKIYNTNKNIPVLEPNTVLEFKLGKKFVYKLNEYHADYDGIFKAHERLVNNFLSKIPISPVAKAYVPEKSYLDFLEPHRNNFYFVRLDLKNFFHSISKSLIKSNFEPYFENQCINNDDTQKLINAFLNIVTYTLPKNLNNKRFIEKCILPMGFKTSPVISNIIFRKIDILIEDFCSLHNITYTRYADDMLFSSKSNSELSVNPFALLQKFDIKPFIHSDRFFEEISYLVKIDGFKINKRKTIKDKHTLSLNGYTIEGTNYSDVQGTIRISNKKTKIISKLIFEVNKGSTNVEIMTKLFGFKASSKYFTYTPPKPEHVERYCRDQVINKTAGYRSYIISLLKYDSKYKCIDAKSIDKYQKYVDGLEMILSNPKVISEARAPS